MKELINWCNQNEGFLSFVLSAVTIVISIIAIKTSINAVKLPFKIKLKVIPFRLVTGSDPIKKVWQSGKTAFIISVSIEMPQLLLRLGTFQLSDIFYNTVGGMIGGLMYCAVMKARKHL